MSRFSIKIAYAIILAGLFVIVVFVGLNYDMESPVSYAILFMLAACVILIGFAAGHNVGAPMKRLLQKAEDLSRGKMTRFEGHDRDEVGELGRALNKIAHQLEKNKHEMTQLERSVEGRVKAKTQDFQEIIVALEVKVKNRTREYRQVLAELEKTKERARTS